jgi:hypothetical protein
MSKNPGTALFWDQLKSTLGRGYYDDDALPYNDFVAQVIATVFTKIPVAAYGQPDRCDPRCFAPGLARGVVSGTSPVAGVNATMRHHQCNSMPLASVPSLDRYASTHVATTL